MAACGVVTEADGADAGNGNGDGDDGELVIVTEELPEGNREVPYEVQLEAEGGEGLITWSVDTLPRGLSADSTGRISGTPSEEGEFHVAVSVSDAGGDERSARMPLVIRNNPVIVTDSLPALHVFIAYDFELTIAGGSPPYDIEVQGLPPQLLMDGDGRIHSNTDELVITDRSSRELEFNVVDSDGTQTSRTLELQVIGAQSISAGTEHTCAIDGDGSAFCWGNGASGQLGNGEDGQSYFEPVPTPVAGEHRFTAISAGGQHTCAIDQEGAAFCWGRGSSGRLGNGDEDNQNQSTPTPVVGGHSFAAISVGIDHTCAIDEAGAAYCWGNSDFGKLGTRSNAHERTPTPVVLLDEDSDLDIESLAAISAGDDHTCAIDDGGAAFCWGFGESGELGNGEDGQLYSEPIPTPVVGEHRFAKISAGSGHTCAIDDKGDAFCWGVGQFGRLGNGESLSKTAPTQVVLVDEDNDIGIQSFSELSAGFSHTCALDDEAAAYCWGSGADGRVGNGVDDNQDMPTPVENEVVERFAAISAGFSHTCAINDAGAAFCWGAGGNGRLGDGDEDSRLVPTPVNPAFPDSDD